MEFFFIFCQFEIIILKIYHYILMYKKKISLFLSGLNRKLDVERLFVYFQYINLNCSEINN